MMRALAMAMAALLAGCVGEHGGTPSGSGGDGGSSSSIGSGGKADVGAGGSTSSQGGSGGGSEGGGGSSYQPEPIPEIDPEPPPNCGTVPQYQFQFLDDGCGDKVFPSDADRERPCPIADDSPVVQLSGGGTVVYQPSSEPVEVDTTSLDGIVPGELMATVILVRRVDGVPHYRYLSTGDHDVAYQPWSTTKFLAAANAASRLRIASSYEVGLTAAVGNKPLGDLVTSIHNYDYDPYSSNALGRYFHDIGGRKRANDLIHALWLGRPSGETFGGNYGAQAPNLGYSFSDGGKQITIQPDTTSGPANHLSSFTMAEAVKRIVLHREEADQRLPGIQWKDIRVLLYGAEGSQKYGPWGGMSADAAIYFQTGHDIDYLEERSKGQWRIFSKLGLGSEGQFLDVGYACLPVLDDELQPVPGWGRELIIAAHLPSGGSTWAERDRRLARAFRAIITRVVDGRL